MSRGRVVMSDQSPTTLYLNPYTGRYELLLQPGKWVSLFAILIVGAMAFGVDKKTEPPPSSSCKSDWHLCTVNAVAGPFQDGQAAFDKGDYLTALKFWLPLANEGNAKAQLQLYSLYIFGDGPKNDAEALKWLRKAAEHDEPSAQFLLGLNYRWGNGVPKDVAEGLAWIRKAAHQGHLDAQYELGSIYSYGSEVPQNDVEARKWYTLAADQGYYPAQMGLVRMYEYGQGGPQDYIQALKWSTILVANARAEIIQYSAVTNRDRLEREMTPAKIAEAQKLASEWKPKPTSQSPRQ